MYYHTCLVFSKLLHGVAKSSNRSLLVLPNGLFSRRNEGEIASAAISCLVFAVVNHCVLSGMFCIPMRLGMVLGAPAALGAGRARQDRRRSVFRTGAAWGAFAVGWSLCGCGTAQGAEIPPEPVGSVISLDKCVLEQRLHCVNCN